MTRKFQTTLMATTMLAGLAIFALDAAQAGPNGPSLGSISSFSSTRIDFNRISGSNRALAREDTRIVPLNVIKKTEKPKETKNAARRAPTSTAFRSPNPQAAAKARKSSANPHCGFPHRSPNSIA